MKDIGLYTALAKETKVPSFYGNTSYQMFDIQSSSGNGGVDFSCVVKMFEDWTGVKLMGLKVEE